MTTDARASEPPARPVVTLLALAALAAALLGYCWRAFSVSSDIGYFLPGGEDDPAAQVLRASAGSALGQRLVLTLGGAPLHALAEATPLLAKELARQREIRAVRFGLDEDAQQRTFELYFTRRHALYDEAPERAYGEALSDAGLQATGKRLIAALAAPDGAFVRRIAPEDPLLAFPRVLGRIAAAREGGLAVERGTFFTQDRSRSVLFVQTRAAVLDGEAQRVALDRVASALAKVRAHTGLRLSLDRAGVGRYSAHAEQAIRHDVTRVSNVASLAFILLFALTFRSLRVVAVVAIPVVIGLLAATAATLLVFGRVHGATLAFGATLIGVAVDYPVHLIGHHALRAREESAVRTLQGVWPALRLGALTTLAGVVVFGVAPLPGVREMALFSAVGVLAALIVTRVALPQLITGLGAPAPLAVQLAGRAAEITWALRERPKQSRWLLLAAAGIALAGLPWMRFEDDLAAWLPASRELRAEDRRVQRQLGAPDPGHLIVASGATEQAALEVNDRVAVEVERARLAGELAGAHSLHALVWSDALQQRNLRALHAALPSRERFEAALDAAGFEATAFEPFWRSLAADVKPLRLEELLASPLAPAVEAFVLELPGKPAFASHLRGVRDARAVARRTARIQGAFALDTRALLAEAYARFRSSVLALTALGLVLVLGMVLVRHRSLRVALAAVLPAVLAATGALSLLALCGVRLDLFHVLGLVLVLSIGEDYGVFLVETRERGAMPATMLSLLLACVSTVLSFGLLALSEIPALRSLGQVIALGVALALIWAPAGLALLPRAEGRA